MKVKRNTFAAGALMIMVILLFFSCSAGLLGDLGRVAADPVVQEPSVVSFEKEGTIEIRWSTDPGADEYILFKAEDALSPVYRVFYRGKELTVTDTDTHSGKRYLYRLTKARGEKLFGPSNDALGVDSGVVQDTLEPNNTKETASTLLYDLQSNLYYYRSYGGEELMDLDWYSVTIPPRRTGYIVVTQKDLTGTDSWMMYALEGNVPAAVVSGQAIQIKNYTYAEKRFFFLISPRSDYFINDPSLGGGNFISYTVSLSQISGL